MEDLSQIAATRQLVTKVLPSDTGADPRAVEVKKNDNRDIHILRCVRRNEVQKYTIKFLQLYYALPYTFSYLILLSTSSRINACWSS